MSNKPKAVRRAQLAEKRASQLQVYIKWLQDKSPQEPNRAERRNALRSLREKGK